MKKLNVDFWELEDNFKNEVSKLIRFGYEKNEVMNLINLIFRGV